METASLVEQYETISKNVMIATLPAIIKLRGMTCRHLRKEVVKPVDEVYGQFAGSSTSDYGLINTDKVLFSGSQWRVITDFEGGYLEDSGYAYCLFDVMNGDLIEFDREGLAVRFSIMAAESVGMSTQILSRFKLSNTGD